MRAFEFTGFELTTDHGPGLPATHTIISRGRFYAGAFKSLPNTSPLHERFWVLRFPNAGAFGVLLAGLSQPLHALHRVPGALRMRAGTVRPAGNGIPHRINEDTVGALSVQARDASQPIKFLNQT